MAITYTDNGGGAANGSDLEFTFTFPVLQTEDVKVALNAIVQATTKYTVDTASNPTKITFNNTSIDSNVQESTGAPKSGVTVRVFRQTQVGKPSGDDDPKAVYAAGSSIRAVDLNANTEQALYAIHELQDQPITDADIEDGAITSAKIQDGAILNVDVNASAAIAGTKIAPDFGSQNVATTGTVNGVTTTELAILDGATVSTAELNTLDGITASTAELNKLDGVTASTAELNILDGVTATTAELNYVDGTASNIQAQLNSISTTRQPLDAELTELATMSSGTASALADLTQAEVQILDGATVSTTELNKLDGVTASTSEINLLDGVTSTTAELNILDGVTASTTEINKLDGVTASTAELNLLDGVTATTTELNLNDGQTATPTEVNILDGATLNTNELNKLDGVTASTTELNLLAGKSIVTSIAGNATDVQIPSAQAVNERVVELVTEVGGFHPIANETSFPTTNPDINDGAGTIVSLKALSSSFSTGSGVTTHTFTNGAGTGNNVTINGLPAATTFPAGRGLLLETTTTSGNGSANPPRAYTYHRLTLDEAGVANAQAVVDDFQERYYGPFSANQATRPSGANRQNGDLYFNTSDGKMKVFNGSHASGTWDDVAAPGNFFINTLSSSSGSGGGQSAFNSVATRFTLSNPPTSAAQLLVSVNGVVQKPNSGTSPSEGFAVDGSDIIFASAPASNAPFFIVTIGSSVNIGTPSDNTVTSAKIVDGSIVNVDISSSAAIAGTKISPDFGSQNIATTGDLTITSAVPRIFLTDSNNNSDFAIANSNGVYKINDETNSLNRFSIASDGTTTVQQNLDVGAGLDVTGNITVTGTVDGVDLQTLNTAVSANTAKVTNATHTGDVTGSTALTLANSGVSAGSYGSSSAIPVITVDAKGRVTAASTAATSSDLVADTSPQLGGDLDTNSHNISLDDDHRIKFGNSDDLRIFHAGGAHSYISNLTNNLYIQTPNIVEIGSTDTNGSNTKTSAKFTRDGSVDLYHNNTLRAYTTNVGLHVNTIVSVPDNGKFRCGAGDDLELYHSGSENHIKGTGNHSLVFSTNNNERWGIEGGGHFKPHANNSYDIGTSSYRVRNIYTNDLHLSNEGHSNDVDGTWGDWTIQEGESDLFLKNNRSGKKYKFNLTEVS